MMRPCLAKVILFIVLLGSPVLADMAEPTPPDQNPHPPITELDKKRVAFAEEAVKFLLFTPIASIPEAQPNPAPSYQNKNRVCLKEKQCLEKDAIFLAQLAKLQKQYGVAKEIRHAHLIPWALDRWNQNRKTRPAAQDRAFPESSKADDMGQALKLAPDEYVVHLYASFSGRWFHVDVILTENDKGEIFLHRFEAFPIPYGEMPPGKVCLNQTTQFKGVIQC